MKLLDRSEYPLFISGLLIKIVCGSLFASYFLTDLFIPFVDYFISSGFSNPYSYFQEIGVKEAFPYPALMLIVLTIPNLMFGWISDNAFFTLFLYRIPLLICDLAIFVVLRSWIKRTDYKYLLWLYWLSPALFFISFIHGQLDVIPISLLILSLNFLFKGDSIKASIFLGLCLATKTMTLIVLPFLFLYLVTQKYSYKQIINSLFITAVVFVIPNLPFLFSDSFYAMVFANQEQNKIFNAFIALGSSSIFLIPVAYLLLLFKGFSIRTYNKDIFIMFLGFAFGIILIFIPPMQGWYYWLLPFLFYFYSKAQSRSFYLVLLLQVFYLLYFFNLSNPYYLSSLSLAIPNIDFKMVSNLIFSLLQTVLILNCFWIYQFGLNSYSKYKISSIPFLLGIGGNSGAGKTTVAEALEQVFQKKKTTLINGDDMHRWERGNNKWSKFTHLDPKANHLHNEIEMVKDLRRGFSIYRKKYNHLSGKFDEEKKLKPNNLILYEGLHPFYLKRLRELFDLRIFLKPSEELRSFWKLNRDIDTRGKTKEEVLNQISVREEDSASYVDIQSEYADAIIEPILHGVNEKDENNLSFKITLPNSVSFDPLIEEIEQINTLKIKHDYKKTDTQQLLVEGFISKEDVTAIASRCVEGLKDIGIEEPILPANPFGVVILIITYLIFEEAYYDETKVY